MEVYVRSLLTCLKRDLDLFSFQRVEGQRLHRDDCDESDFDPDGLQVAPQLLRVFHEYGRQANFVCAFDI
jgi:hypothetical protein